MATHPFENNWLGGRDWPTAVTKGVVSPEIKESLREVSKGPRD